MNNLSFIKVGQFLVCQSNLSDIIKWLKNRIDSDKTTTIVTINPEIYLSAIKNKNHCQAINNADLIIADGVGIVWADNYYHLRNFHNKLLRFLASLYKTLFYKKCAGVSRITGVDLTLHLCQENVLPIKIFGTRGQSSSIAKEKLVKRFSSLEIEINSLVEVDECGCVDQMSLEFLTNKKCLALLALGAPKQELLMNKIAPLMPAGSIVIGVGGTVDFISGYSKRAPKIFRRNGLEWLFRLIKEPSRWKRIVNALFVFPYNFIKINK